MGEVEIPLNPYQGLKQKVWGDLLGLNQLKFHLIPIRD